MRTSLNHPGQEMNSHPPEHTVLGPDIPSSFQKFAVFLTFTPIISSLHSFYHLCEFFFFPLLFDLT